MNYSSFLIVINPVIQPHVSIFVGEGNHMLLFEKSTKKIKIINDKIKLGNYAMTAHFSKLACAAHVNFLCL